MTDATDLWATVKSYYDSEGLIPLTNIRERGLITIDDTVGTTAAQSVLNLWPAYAQVAYDSADALHAEVASFGVIALLWRRGGTSSTIEQVKWDEVFGDGGLIEKVRRTDPRGHRGPRSSSGVTASAENKNGNIRGWSDPDSLPITLLPKTVRATED